MTKTPAPRTDSDTFDVLDQALTALADRRHAWLGDDPVVIHLLVSLISQAERCLPELVTTARANGHTWDELAVLLGTSPHETQLRFAPTHLPPTAGGHKRPTDQQHTTQSTPRRQPGAAAQKKTIGGVAQSSQHGGAR